MEVNGTGNYAVIHNICISSVVFVPPPSEYVLITIKNNLYKNQFDCTKQQQQFIVDSRSGSWRHGHPKS